MIKCVLIDVDNTILDFNKSAETAMKLCLKKHNVEYSENMIKVFNEVNDRLWLEIERGELTKNGLYSKRWNTIFQILEIPLDGTNFELDFIEALKECAQPVDGAADILKYLSLKYTVCAASNAPHEQQLKRLERAGLLKYVSKVFTSEKIGFEKPSKEFFDACFEELVFSKEETILIGDSISADITGGINYNIKTCWFNYNKQPIPKLKIDYVINSLDEIKRVL